MENNKAAFRKNGYVILRNFLDKDVLNTIYREAQEIFAVEIKRILQREVAIDDRDEFDKAMLELYSRDFEAFAETDKAVRRLVSLRSLGTDEKIIAQLEALGLERPVTDAHPVVQLASRFLPKDGADDREADPRNGQGFSDSAVIWFPLAPAGNAPASIRVAQASHLKGNQGTGSPRPQEGFELALRQEDFVRTELEAGDAVILSPLLAHEPGSSTTEAIQWSIQFRYHTQEEAAFAEAASPMASAGHKPEKALLTQDSPTGKESGERQPGAIEPKKKPLKVTVGITTYNQAAFIGKAIESAVAQVTDFDYEILVGDDFSTDGTREIILDYQKRYPDKVKPVLHPRNLGQNGFFNATETLKLARADYIAPMDGDDYWTDSSKLQRMVDFLDAHPDYSACFHNALVTHEDGSPSYELNPPDQKMTITLDDLIGEDEVWFIATSAVLFRGHLMYYPEWFRKSSSGDIPRYIILAKQGPIGYVPGIMSVYRKNSRGVSFRDHYRDARFLRNRIMMYNGINRESGFVYNSRVTKNIARYYRMLLNSRQYSRSYFSRAALAFRYLWMRKPPMKECREIVRQYIVPQWLLAVYSFFALLPHKLRQTAEDVR